jgi:hypothetical protein
MSKSNSEVEFRKIPSLKFLYEVSEDGRIVRNVKSKHHLRQEQDRSGYFCVHLVLNGKQVHRFVHILVAECWHGSKPEGFECDHIDHNKHNNHYKNLRYVTKAENLSRRVFTEEGKRRNGEITKARYEAMSPEQQKKTVEPMLDACRLPENQEKRMKAFLAAVAHPITLEKDGERLYFDSQKKCCEFIAEKDNCSDGAIYYYIKQRRKYIHGYHVTYEK